MSTTITTHDISELAAPDSVTIPDRLEDACLLLGGVGGVMSAGHWGTAAIVWAYVEPGEPHFASGEKSSDGRLTISEFAELKIRGLSTRDSVRKYRRAWEDAIARGWAEPARPGEGVTLPSRPFKTESGAHVGQNSGENEWYTPPPIVEAARSAMGGIDLDPASTPAANTIVKAKTFYRQQTDGLSQNWAGRVWLNPPYELSLIRRFAEKLVDSYLSGGVEQACILVNNATDTAWWQHVSLHASALCLPAGRVRLWHPHRDSCAPLQGQAILYLGNRQHKFCEEFSSFGDTWSRTDSTMATREGIHSQLGESHCADLLRTNASGGRQNCSGPEDGQ